MTTEMKFQSRPTSGRRQCGIALVEFAFVAPVFFLLLFGVIEFGRLLYLWNTVQEITRYAAREAVVTDFTKTTAINAIKQAAVFNSSTGSLPGSGEVTAERVRIRYVYASGQVVDTPGMTPADNVDNCGQNPPLASCIVAVEACVSVDAGCTTGVPFDFLLGYLPATAGLTIPPSTVRMPAESLGYVPALSSGN